MDDDRLKTTLIRQALRELATDIRVTGASNIVDALKLLRAESFDLLIVDLNVPMRKGESARPDGGVQLVELLRRGRGPLPAHIVALTEYDDLASQHQKAFSGDLIYVVRFDRSSRAWSEAIGRKLLAIERSQAPRERGGYDYDLAVVTALTRVELEAVLELPISWRRRNVPEDDTIYHEGCLKRAEGDLRVIAAAAPEMGMPATTALAMKMICGFRPRYIAMVGIAAGLKGGFGDVLIADISWDYGSGKFKERPDGKGGVFEPGPTQLRLDARVRARLEDFSRDQTVAQRILHRWNGDPVPRQIEVAIGPVASGAAVVDSHEMIEQIRAQQRKVVGVEMETYGVFMAARNAPEPKPIALSFKSVSDFGSQKGDDYQRFAAFTSAQFLYEFACSGLEWPHSRS
ncbi:hypothetical protein [Anaeromyxobacter dehalogenans]|uniref:phosphorylase family protein n=1 Tax=Anaeromyxobacter dehalogenans TaxID=161493 RepID=UPI0018DCE3A2|nr:hypothetical protein [Anaeromyxobacter dehalogenans]